MRQFLLTALLALAVPLPAFAPPAAAAQTANEAVWPFEQSDLPVDPAYRFGVLDNGMRYIIRPNATPAGQGMVQLWIDGGSLDEREDERGFAHFVEHMAFNGSTNLPEGEMIKLLEREGLAFGADTNASTSFDATIYKLDLPRNDPDLLDTALMIMRETASELSFNPEAVEREKGVVLSERRVRDTYALRNTIDGLEFLYPEARLSERLPIGTAETIRAADAAALRALYERLYRPDDAALIVVGEFDPDVVEASIREHFADWAGPQALEGPDAGPIDPVHAGLTDIYLDPALAERITIARSGPWIEEADTVASRRANLLRRIGYGIVNRRFQRLSRGEDPPFRGAGFGTSEVFEAGRTTNLIVDAGDKEWRRALEAAQREYRRAMAFGFSEGEVAEQVANLRTALENAAAGADTRSHASFVNAALALLADDQIPTTPESALKRFEEIAPQITPDAVMAALREEAIPLDNPLIRFEGRTAPVGGAEAIRSAWDAGMAEQLEAGRQADLGEFGYTDFGPAGSIVSDTVEPLLGIRQIRFANGVMLNLKQTDLQEDRVTLQINIDGGQMLNTKADPLATAMVSSLPFGGLGKHTYDELQSILAGRTVSLPVGAADDTFQISATTTPRDLEVQLQLIAATLTDPGYRPQGEAQYRRNIENFFASRDATPASALRNSLGQIVSDGDSRFTLQPKEDYLQLTFEALRQDISERLDKGAIEVAAVGDFDEERLIELVARTLGALPPREEAFQAYEDNRRRGFTADRAPRVLYHTGGEDQALLQMMWPTTGDEDFAESARLELLERVMRLELLDSLREELGQTYSPGVSAQQSRTYEDYGTFTIGAAIDVADVDAAREAMLQTVRKLTSEPVSEDELLRARQPMIEAYDNALKTNAGWMNLVDRAQTEADRIERFTIGKETLAALTAEDLRSVASRYLEPTERLELLVLPEPDQQIVAN